MPKMRLRVVCGLGVTMESFVPRMALSNVDFPTLGLPMMATKPAFVCVFWLMRLLEMGKTGAEKLPDNQYIDV